jgi:hypothetical protein
MDIYIAIMTHNVYENIHKWQVQDAGFDFFSDLLRARIVHLTRSLPAVAR